MNARIVITLDPDEAKALIQLAQDQYRHPRELVALLIHNELEKSGLLDKVQHRVEELQAQAAPNFDGHTTG
ncbi:MAG: hypothetical protein C3F13_09990 [Anaerolineales bacterium]|nr:hypothetical protein [Anaerolineae bacterium]PWB53155.1 MAG: hypothetical protein C3F13_09990 [Anaerolineales bacterium]